MQSWTVGDVKVTAIVESEAELSSRLFLPTATLEELMGIDWLRPTYISERGRIQLWIQAFVLETPGLRIVVDTCMGNDKPREGNGGMLKTDFLQRFEAAGFPRTSIDRVLC